jgi:hypothetical protein
MKTNYLSFTNSKLKVDDIFTWGIPAGEPKTGIITCPNAGSCAKGCYAMQGFYVMPNVAKKQEERLALALSASFVDVIDAEIKARKVKRLRIHDSGDFFSVSYTNKWIEVMRRNPGVRFYAYTKMVTFFKAREKVLPDNFHVIYSEGGKQDGKINLSVDRHSRVFPSIEQLKAAKYSDASKRDYVSLMGKKLVGLVYHGAPSRAWETAGAIA